MDRARDLQSVGAPQRARRHRVSEIVAILFFSYLAVASVFFRVGMHATIAVWLVNALIVAVLWALGREGSDASRIASAGKQGWFALQCAPVIRDWLPAPLILVAYRESGLLYVPDRTRFWDLLFERWDRVILHSHFVIEVLRIGAPWLERYLEFSYLLCYPFVPLGLAALYVAHHWRSRRSGARGESPEIGPDSGIQWQKRADRFWTTVLISAFTAYALFPLFPSTPPRILFHDFPAAATSPILRRLNLLILNRYGIVVSVFPSGHVANVSATALAVFREFRVLGLFFLAVAAGIAAATVYGRYHYTADAVAGALIGFGAWTLSRYLHRAA